MIPWRIWLGSLVLLVVLAVVWATVATAAGLQLPELVNAVIGGVLWCVAFVAAAGWYARRL